MKLKDLKLLKTAKVKLVLVIVVNESEHIISHKVELQTIELG